MTLPMATPASTRTRSSRSPRFARLAHLFLVDTLAEAATVRTALRSGDLQRARVFGHHLKGGGGTFGYPQLSDLGACLQSLAEAEHTQPMADLVQMIARRLRQLVDLSEPCRAERPAPVQLGGASHGPA